MSEIKTATYFTHDNGGRPFKVVITDGSVSVFPQDNTEEEAAATYAKEAIYTCDKPTRIFIGDSPLNAVTLFSGGYGDKDCDGNTILIENGTETVKKGAKLYNYIFVGSQIVRFSTATQIIAYTSPIGNNDVPYPLGADRTGNMILLLDFVLMPASNIRNIHTDVYSYFYERNPYCYPLQKTVICKRICG